MVWNSATKSFNRLFCPLIRYLLSPLRYKRRVIATSSASISNIRLALLNTKVTSQYESGFRSTVPLKITSCIFPPRNDFADCSPKTQRTASATLLLPQPFGPTIQVTPSSNRMVVLSANDLNPKSCISRKSNISLLPLLIFLYFDPLNVYFLSYLAYALFIYLSFVAVFILLGKRLFYFYFKRSRLSLIKRLYLFFRFLFISR